MTWVAFIILLSLIEFIVLGAMVGYARSKYGVKAPATSGHEIFDRHFRVHYNTLEQLIVFLPSLWLFATYVNAEWAAILGAVFIVSRILYAIGYVADPKKREVGSVMSSLSVIPLLLGALYGVIKQLI